MAVWLSILAVGMATGDSLAEVPLLKGFQPAAKSAVVSAATERIVLDRLESLLVTFVRVFDDRLSFYLELAGETALTRAYTEKEFRELVVDRVQQLFLGQIYDIVIAIHPDGFVGSATLFIESQAVELITRMGIVAVNDRPHVAIQEVRINSQVVDQGAKTQLEDRVNRKIDQSRFLIKVKWIDLSEGRALLSVARKG